MEFLDIDKKYNENKLKKMLGKYLLQNTSKKNKYNTDISFALFDKGNFIGGITANIEFETCFLDLLSVDEKYRGKKNGIEINFSFRNENKRKRSKGYNAFYARLSS